MTFARISQLSPSTKFVLKILQLNGRMTQGEIVGETTLSPRTVKYAIKKLKESNIIHEKPRISDMRGKYYEYSNGQNLH